MQDVQKILDIHTYFTDGEIIAIVLFLIGLQSFILFWACEGIKARMKELDKALKDLHRIEGVKE